MTNSSPGTRRAETLYQVRGALGIRPDRAAPFRALSLSPPCRTSRRSRGARAHEARRPASRFRCRSASTSTDGCKRAKTPWDAFPDAGTARWTPRPAALAEALRYPNVEASRERARRAPAARVRRQAHRRGRGERRRRAQASSRRGSSCLRRARSIPRRCCCARRSTGSPTAPDAVGRHFMNHNCSAVAGDRSARSSTIRSIRRRSASTISISTTGTAGRRSATSSCSGRVTAPILKSNICPRAGVGAFAARAPRGRLVCDERGPAQSREPRDGRRRADPSRLEAQQLVGARWAGRRVQGTSCARRAIRSC